MNMDSNQENKFKLQQIIKLLEDEKGLKLKRISSQQQEFGSIIFIKDIQNEEFTVKIVSLSSDKDDELICPEKLKEAKEFALNLQNCKHENIIKYVDEFQLGSYYFIIMESCVFTLHNWIEKNNLSKIHNSIFIKFSLEILYAVEYLHSQSYLVANLTPQNICVDKNLKIKVCEFGFAKEINMKTRTEQFLQQKIKSCLFYLPPEFIDLKQNQESNDHSCIENQIGDIWIIGVCFYLIAGAGFLHIKQFTRGYQFYQYQTKVDKEINNIIIDILQLYPKGRPSIQKIIEQIQSLKYDQDFIFSLTQQFQDLIVKIEEEGPVDTPFLDIFDQGKEKYNSELFEESIEYFKKALEINPHSCEVMNYIGSSYAEMKKIDDAIHYYLLAIKENPEYVRPYNNLSKQYYDKKMYAEAIAFCEKAIELQPDNAYAYNGLGNCYQSQGELDQAILQFKKTIEINPHFYYAYFNLGICYFDQNSIDEAIQEFIKLVEFLPNDIDALCYLAHCYQLKNMNEEAISYFKKVLELNPKKIVALIELAKTYKQSKMNEESIATLKEIIKIDPNYKRVYNELGNIYFSSRMQNFSIPCYQHAINIDPKYSLALYNLGLSLKQQSHFEKSIQILKVSMIFDDSPDSEEQYNLVKSLI